MLKLVGFLIGVVVAATLMAVAAMFFLTKKSDTVVPVATLGPAQQTQASGGVTPTNAGEPPMDSDLLEPPPEEPEKPAPIKSQHAKAQPPAEREVAPPRIAEATPGEPTSIATNASAWEPFWQFNSKASAELFSAHLRKLTGLDLAVFERGHAQSVVAFSYSGEVERVEKRQRIEERASIKIWPKSPLASTKDEEGARL